MTCFPSILLLFLPPPISHNHFSCHWSSQILFTVLKIRVFSLHLYQFACQLLWWLLHFSNFISRSSLFLYFKSQILPFPSPPPFCLPPAFSFFFLSFNFSLSYPDFHSSLLVLLLPLLSQNHFSFL